MVLGRKEGGKRKRGIKEGRSTYIITAEKMRRYTKTISSGRQRRTGRVSDGKKSVHFNARPHCPV